ncbi:hypothetical protein [Azospirillum canadense]|uniref:hypothetical protein n=1 Tax=Azospirillum canadense TaxID=403962 RepID=UPI00222602E4|nr:hypothetical protein [Azospirillum canadense]MCW2241770.1 hypothetical protein [Azospirillum canadense]
MITPLREAVTSWLETIDVLSDHNNAGPYACMRDGLADLVAFAEAAEPSPLRDAVLSLAEGYDDLAVLTAVGLRLSPQIRTAAVERVLRRFDAVARLVEEQRPPP